MEIKDIMAVYKITIFIFIVTLTFNGCFNSGTKDDEEIPTDTTEVVSGLLEPKNGITLNYIHVLFEWEQIPDASYYTIQLSDEPTFTTPIVSTHDSSLLHLEKSNIEWESLFYWRVRGYDSSGPVGEWKGPSRFTTSSPMSDISVKTFEQDQAMEGITVFSSFFNYFSAVIDFNGREIWNSGDENLVYYNYSKSGNIFGSVYQSDLENNLPGKEFSFIKGRIWEEPNDDFLHHDLIKLPNGNYLGIVEKTSIGPIPVGSWTNLFQNIGYIADGLTPEFTWVGDKLIEWDKDTKEVVWSWDVFDHFNMEDYDQFGGTWHGAYQSLKYDWTHVNAVIFDEDESAIYISTRHLSRITKIDYPSGEIIWNMGHQMPSGDVDMGTDIGFSFQHSLQKLDNGNILTFDNGNLAPEFRGTDEPVSRAIEITIDDNSAELTWSYELPADLFGFASGNVQKLDNGNVLATTVGGGGTSIEVNPDGEVVWDVSYNLSLPLGAVYRAHRIQNLYPSLFYIIIDNLQEVDGNPALYFEGDNPTISLRILNEGTSINDFNYEIIDDLNWFNQENGQTQISSNGEITLIFTGSSTGEEEVDTIIFSVVPTNHEEYSKSVSFRLYKI